jgi:hypothetical protein
MIPALSLYSVADGVRMPNTPAYIARLELF